MKKKAVLAFVLALLCLPVLAVAESNKTERMTVDGITYEVTYPSSIICPQNSVEHQVVITFFMG